MEVGGIGQKPTGGSVSGSVDPQQWVPLGGESTSRRQRVQELWDTMHSKDSRMTRSDFAGALATAPGQGRAWPPRPTPWPLARSAMLVSQKFRDSRLSEAVAMPREQKLGYFEESAA